MAPWLVNGLDIVCTWRAPGYHAENLLLQVWASLYRVGEITKEVEFQPYKCMQPDKNARCAFILTADARRYVLKK